MKAVTSGFELLEHLGFVEVEVELDVECEEANELAGLVGETTDDIELGNHGEPPLRRVFCRFVMHPRKALEEGPLQDLSKRLASSGDWKLPS